MKTLKTLLSIFAIAAVFSIGAFAQNSGTVAANAEVVGAISVATNSMDYGLFVSTGDVKTISFTDADAGEFAVTGASTSAIDVTIDFPATLDPATLTAGVSSENELATSGYEAGFLDATSADPSSAVATPFSLAGQQITGQVTPSNSSFFVYVGMTVTSESNDGADTYSGDIDLTLEYN